MLAAVKQADGLLDGRIVRIAEPAVLELRPLVAAMNLTVARLRSVFELSSAQLEVMRQQAQLDALTGLSNRRHFLALLERALGEKSPTPRVGMLMLRVCDLHRLQRRLGRLQADSLLQTVAQVLQAYVLRIDGCCAGRLNAADFCLLLPAGDVAEDTASVLARTLQVQLALIDSNASVAIGAAELDSPMALREALALTDEALAQAEADRPFSVTLAALATHPHPPGEREWRQWLVEALAQRRVSLQEQAVRTPDGRLLHLSCQVNVQSGDGGALATSQRWLAFAQRSGLCAAIDQRALELVLRDIAADAQPRSIGLAAQSLGRSEFMALATRLLEASPSAAGRLWIDLPESLALDRPEAVIELSRRWRPLGVSLVLTWVGDGLPRIHGLMAMGLDSVRVDARHVQQLSEPRSSLPAQTAASRRSRSEGINSTWDGPGFPGPCDAERYLGAVVRLVQAAGLTIIADGVSSQAHLELLWRLGFDAASGPVIEPQGRSPVAA